jgi:hypothetical protein
MNFFIDILQISRFQIETRWNEHFAMVHHASSCTISSGNIETNWFVDTQK